jgi:hypothetical protein
MIFLITLLSIKTENAIAVVERVFDEYEPICPHHELIMDHGSEFDVH